MIGWKKLAGAAALTFACAHAWATPMLTFSTPAAPAAVGATVNVDVRISDIGDLSGYQFGVTFDNTLLHLTGVSTGSFMNGGDTSAFGSVDFDDTDGTLDYVYDATIGAGSNVSGDGVLVTLSFTTLAAGSAALDFTNVAFIDPDNSDIAVLAAPATLRIGAASADVPEPASLSLLGIGALALLRRRAGTRLNAGT